MKLSAPEQQDLVFSDDFVDFHPPRADKRERVVHIVEYSPYPRSSAGQHTHIGYTRDHSAGGMCFGAKTAARVADLVRLTVRGIDGSAAYEGLARVAWCERRPGGGFWVGVVKLVDTRRQMRRVPEQRARLERMTA